MRSPARSPRFGQLRKAPGQRSCRDGVMKRFKPAIWFCVCLLLGLAAVSVWRANLERRMERSSQRAAAPRSVAPQLAPSVASAPSAQKPRKAATAAVSVRGHIPASKVDAQTARFHATDSRPHRLSNTRRAYGELERRDTAILLRNAVIDTAETVRGLPIPAGGRGSRDLAGPGATEGHARIPPAAPRFGRALFRGLLHSQQHLHHPRRAEGGRAVATFPAGAGGHPV